MAKALFDLSLLPPAPPKQIKSKLTTEQVLAASDALGGPCTTAHILDQLRLPYNRNNQIQVGRILRAAGFMRHRPTIQGERPWVFYPPS